MVVKGVVFGEKWLYTGRVVEFGQNLLYSGKVVVFLTKVIVFGE